MIETIVLITQVAAEQETFGAILRECNPLADIVGVTCQADFERLGPRQLARSRLIACCTDLIVPEAILAGAGFGAYNFHPGPPGYPGWLPTGFAIYDGARIFGVTAHVMAAKVDSGAIVATSMFDVPCQADLLMLERMTYLTLIRLFRALAPALMHAESGLPPNGMAWGSRLCSRREVARLCAVTRDIDVTELQRRVRAFGALAAPKV